MLVLNSFHHKYLYFVNSFVVLLMWGCFFSNPFINVDLLSSSFGFFNSLNFKYLHSYSYLKCIILSATHLNVFKIFLPQIALNTIPPFHHFHFINRCTYTLFNIHILSYLFINLSILLFSYIPVGEKTM